MDKYRVLLAGYLALTTIPAFASRYSSPGEAAFVGALQALLIGGVIWVVGAIKNKNKKDDE